MARILVIDDDEQMLLFIQTMLERAGYEAMTARNGLEGMKICRNHPVDLVITDIIMPDMEGLEIIMELKKEFSSVKIIAVSGGARNKPFDYLCMAAKLGANYTFTKPFDRKELLMAVKKLVG